eukprot:CAMPEP_0169454358 /NCGR_PEP_ID=MMETSP1042-20121227/15238_1 /TAXON_ID=464988 /ORGANISM="Hemiselmis andersenii, Strain CCMP1180" /LENGTH=201 /DNA_ID=CAMNT_0009566431 /DNA_START=203 /DNA_END=805 /DNA_ORIENTATION=+
MHSAATQAACRTAFPRILSSRVPKFSLLKHGSLVAAGDSLARQRRTSLLLGPHGVLGQSPLWKSSASGELPKLVSGHGGGREAGGEEAAARGSVLGRVARDSVKEYRRNTRSERGLLHRFKGVIAEYGRIAFLFHCSGSVLTLGGAYAAAKLGADVRAIVDVLPPYIADHVSDELGALALAVLALELTAPPRWALTIVAAP